MKKLSFAFLALLLTLISMQAFAQSSLGIGSNEVALQPTGPFAHLILWVNELQREFYLSMTNALRAMREDPRQASILVWLSFLYGILHAAGPGHGKAVISSYMVANETALRRGILLSFISSILQALSAIVIVGLAFLVLRGTGISMNQTARFMEIISFALVFLFGLWLLFRKLPSLFRGEKDSDKPSATLMPIPQPAFAAPSWEGSISQSTKSAAISNKARLNYQPAQQATNHTFVGAGDICAECGSAHIADPATLSGEFDWKTAWSAILSVGLRPCSGALIVLTFAMLNGLVTGGLISVFAMSLGTFITVAVLATMAVTAKNTVLRLAGKSAMSGRVKAAIEVAAALFIVFTGGVLLSAALLV